MMPVDEIHDRLRKLVCWMRDVADDHPDDLLPILDVADAELAFVLRDLREHRTSLFEAARYLSVDLPWLRERVRSGDIPAETTADGNVFFTYRDLRSYKDASEMVLDELARLGQELGDDDDPPARKLAEGGTL